MKKIYILIISVVLLVGCSKSINNSDSVKKENKKGESTMQFIVPKQNNGQTSDIIEYGKKLVKEHPEIGEEGEISIYYVGATYKVNEIDHAVFMFVNKTKENLKKDLELKISWSYDDQVIYDNQIIDFKIADQMELPDNSATFLLTPITSSQKEIVDKMTEESKMKLEIIDIQVKG